MYLQSPENFSIDEDLIYVCTNFLKYSGRVTKSTQIIFPYLIDYMNRNEGLTLDLFEIYLLYINNGVDFFSKEIEYVSKYFIDIFKYSLEEDQKYETSFINGCMLIQTFLQKINFIPLNSVSEIVSYSIFTLTSITVNLPSMEECMKYTALHKMNAVITVIFSCILNYPHVTIEIIQKNKEIMNFILWNDILISSKFVYPYIIKVRFP